MFVMGTVFQFPELLLLPVQFYSKYFQLYIDPLQAFSDNGVAMYRRVLQIIGQRLLNNCSLCTQ